MDVSQFCRNTFLYCPTTFFCYWCGRTTEENAISVKKRSWNNLEIHLWAIIFSFSAESFADIYKFGLINRHIFPEYYGKRILQQLAAQTMEKLILNEFCLSFEEFIEVLGKTDSVVTGEFPLQCILGSNFNEVSDIDIYVQHSWEINNESNMKEFSNFLEKSLYSLGDGHVFQESCSRSPYASMVRIFERDTGIQQIKRIKITTNMRPYHHPNVYQVSFQCIPVATSKLLKNYHNQEDDIVRGYLPRFSVNCRKLSLWYSQNGNP